MGIDYDGVGGIGIEITKDVLEKFISFGLFTEEQWDEDYYDCLEKIGLLYNTAGNFYSGDMEDLTHYLFVRGNNLQEILDNEPEFISALEKFGITISRKDLIVISDHRVS